ncbi:MAG: carnitine dehydratase [Frankiales bacterium]|nr:carnitine dehydratase [Frankiales bacterium]
MRVTTALQGVVVLDLGQVYNGPYCTHLLRHLGATVVKVEPPSGDPVRWRSDSATSGQAFMMLNAGKRGLRLDLKHPEGKALFLDLVRCADVVVENFAPGALDRLGLDWPTLSQANPRLVLASSSGYGSDGPYSALRGMDVTVQAMTAVLATTGFPDGGPVKAGPALADFGSGVHLACAVLAALFQRERTGLGQRVEVAMQDAVLPSLTSNIAGALEGGPDFPERTGNRHGGLAVVPYNVYPASDGWMAVLCLRDRHWEALCAVMQRPDLAADAALATPSGRVARMDDVDAAISAWTVGSSKDELFRLLQDADIPSAPVRSLHEVIHDPHLRHRGMLQEVGRVIAGPRSSGHRCAWARPRSRSSGRHRCSASTPTRCWVNCCAWTRSGSGSCATQASSRCTGARGTSPSSEPARAGASSVRG